MERIFNSAHHQDAIAMSITVAPSPEEKFEDDDIVPKGDVFLAEDASRLSAEDTTFQNSAAEIAHLRGFSTSDARLNIYHHCSWNMRCSFHNDCEESGQGVLPYPEWTTYCHQPQEPAMLQPPSSCPCTTAHLPEAFVSPLFHCCGILQGCNAQHRSASCVCTLGSPLAAQSLLCEARDRTSTSGLIDLRKATHPGLSQKPYACTFSGCKGRFQRQKALNRHILNHLGVKPYTCWVQFCLRKFSRSDNLNAHYLTHGKHGGRNLYVATLDPTSPAFNPAYRGRLTPEGWPLDIQWAGPDLN